MRKRFRINKQVMIKRTVCLAVFFLSAALLFSVYKYVCILKSYRESAEGYQKISDIALSAVLPVPSAASDMKETPAISEVPITADWDALRKCNREVIAWLCCGGTPINYPVVQSKDNAYYLTRGFDRSKNESGALFLDCRNNIASNDENFIIYGHRMTDDSMFGTIPQYAEKSYFEQHSKMYLLTPGQNYRVELFACRTVHSEDKYFETCFESKNAFQQYLNKALEQSYWLSDTPVGTDYPSLTLVTCSTYGNAKNPSLLVHGVLVPITY